MPGACRRQLAENRRQTRRISRQSLSIKPNFLVAPRRVDERPSHRLAMFRSSLRVLHAAARGPAPRSIRRAFHPSPPRRDLVSAADLQFGQPLHETHPHLLKPGEGESPSCQLPSCIGRTLTGSHSHSRNHRPRICEPPRRPRPSPAAEQLCYPSSIRHQISLRRRLL